MSNNFTIRKAELKDIPAIIKMYQDTVRNVNSIDYTPAQIKVWAEGAENKARWKSAINEQYFLLAEEQTTPGLKPDPSLKKEESINVIAGFASIAADGYLDFLYVSKDHQRKGAALMLLNEIETKARKQNNREIYSHVSKTAKGFFLKHGYKHVKDLEDPYRGEIFINALMRKLL